MHIFCSFVKVFYIIQKCFVLLIGLLRVKAMYHFVEIAIYMSCLSVEKEKYRNDFLKLP